MLLLAIAVLLWVRAMRMLTKGKSDENVDEQIRAVRARARVKMRARVSMRREGNSEHEAESESESESERE